MQIAQLVATRSTCVRRQIGAVLVRDNYILSTGYNGAPAGYPHCLDVGCMRIRNNIESGERTEICMAVHSEANCIIQASNHGVSIQGATLYVTNHPCSYCSRMIANSGISRLVYKDDYPDNIAKVIMETSRLDITKL